ncbi:hypothetical protein [Streptomyces acidicola]|uniref:Uncharacterized protein n=1 Tax=Streptomyces acidicola TaxID=2596892 RepID=A0A5N8WSZ9_9ACTN|nr:hypothetical protein [Streptomyces acidicola]MPY49946.1 hypothetical protein [Streptomyces acidicola]
MIADLDYGLLPDESEDHFLGLEQAQLVGTDMLLTIHLTLLRHRPAGPALGTLLEKTPYRLVDTLPQARAVLARTEHSPNGTRSTGQQEPTGPDSSLDDAQWITSPAWSDGVVTDRPKHAPGAGARPSSLPRRAAHRPRKRRATHQQMSSPPG